MKRQRTLWLEDKHFKKLKLKAQEHFSGKGLLERYLELIAESKIIILQGDGGYRIIPE